MYWNDWSIRPPLQPSLPSGREQSTRFCSLRDTIFPVFLKCWASRAPVVLKAQQEPHWPCRPKSRGTRGSDYRRPEGSVCPHSPFLWPGSAHRVRVRDRTSEEEEKRVEATDNKRGHLITAKTTPPARRQVSSHRSVVNLPSHSWFASPCSCPLW